MWAVWPLLVASSQLTRPIEALSGLWNEVIGSASHAARVFEMLDLEKRKQSRLTAVQV